MAKISVDWQNIDEDAANQLLEWWKRARINQHMLYREQKRYENIHIWLGIPAIGISVAMATLGILLVRTINEEIFRIVVAVLGFLTALLTSLQTFLKFNEHATMCKTSATQYGKIVRRIELLLSQPPEAGQLEKDSKIVLRKLDDAATSAPTISDRRWNRFKDNPPSWGLPQIPTKPTR